MIKVAIIGGAGQSGLELIRILQRHPQVEMKQVTSDKYAGKTVPEIFPALSHVNLGFSPHDSSMKEIDVAFLAVPNQVSLERVPPLLDDGLRVIDLSGVFRLHDPEVFEEHYNIKHTAPEILKKAVFGLPEAFREEIKTAQLVANPGCYPTGALLGLLPLAELAGDLAIGPIIDAKSGVSGAGGRVEDDSTNFMEVNENFKAYKIFQHQHTPEISQYLSDLTTFDPERHGKIIFTPHLLPIERGILTTIYLQFNDPVDPKEMYNHFAKAVEEEPFLILLPQGDDADMKMVQHTNNCVIAIHYDKSLCHWVVITAIDNLGKGASWQAVQNMNLMFGLEETTGLI